MKSNIIKALKINKWKVLSCLIVVFVLTPIISMIAYPHYGACGRASGSAFSENKATWGIRPFTFLGISRGYYYDCDFRSDVSCHATNYDNKLSLDFYYVLGGGGIINVGFSKYLLEKDINLQGIPIPLFFNIIIDVAINLIISYLFISILLFIYFGLRNKKTT